MQTKVCSRCKKDKEVSNFYWDKAKQKYYYHCRACEAEKKRILNKKKFKGGFGNSESVPIYPNQYIDEEQRLELFEFMQSMGWKFNKNTANWYNNKLRDKDGNWLVEIKSKIKRKVPVAIKDINCKRRYLDVDQLPIVEIKDKTTFKQEDVDNIVYLYYHKCVSITDIDKLYPNVETAKVAYIITRSNYLLKKNTDGTRTSGGN